MKHYSFIIGLFIALVLSILATQPALAKQIKGIVFDVKPSEIEILIPTGKVPTAGMHVELFKPSENDQKQSIVIWTITRTDINSSYAIPLKTTGKPQPGYIALIGPPEQKPVQPQPVKTITPPAQPAKKIITPSPAPKPAPVVKTLAPKSKKKTSQKKAFTKKTISLSRTDQKLFNDLSSKKAARIRSAARELCKGNYQNPVIMDKAAQTLEQQFNPARASSLHVDAMAWICKALWVSGKPEYIDILKKVEKQAKHAKLRKYAYKYRRGLEKKNRHRKRRK
ncbi:MAG: hypothetical protein KAR45_10345 [Desulfobacteraceae bacterium]|nr:hypothetical protein [Desulfobacteraceae bacterium]